MKRLICTLFILIFLFGCTRNGDSFSVNKDSLNNSFHSKIDDNEYKGSISFDEKNNMFITITYPDEISGFSIYFCGESVTATMKDVEDNYETSDFSDNFAFLCLYNAIKKAVTDGIFVKNGNSAYEMSYDDVTIVADEQGNITSAAVKNGFFIFGG